MSRYDELRSAYADFDDAKRQFLQENLKIALEIVNGFAKFVEAPKSFESSDGRRGRSQVYITIHELDEEGSVLPEPEFADKAVTHLMDGTFNFGIGVIVERSAESFPKNRYLLPIRCRRQGNRVEVDLSEGPGQPIPLRIEFDGEQCRDIGVVHHAIYDLLLAALSRRPGEGEPRGRMGFMLTPVS